MATSPFAAMLPALYQRLGDLVQYHRVGDAPVDVRVMLDVQGGAGGIDAVMQGDRPQLRAYKAALPQGVLPGDRFVFADVTYTAVEPGIPLLDGHEWLVPVRREPA